ncbi:MAG: phosphogluconate dehydrogenase (NAD(+)-dependent, decarboxylating) [Candidatus Zipacnadales bacterium]
MTDTIELGFQGLGKMGLNMVRRLRRDGHRVVCYGRTPSKRPLVEEIGAEWVTDLPTLVARLAPPRTHWMMVPADAVEETIAAICPLLTPGDVLVDGGNSHYRDTIRRSQELAQHGVHYVDVGTSGGVWGLESGYCLMVGGRMEDYTRLEPALKTLAPPEGYMHVGPTGAGHFVKMVHNGIEYGIMEALAEGFELLAASPFDLSLSEIAHLWNHGSVIRSWLLELTERILTTDPRLEHVEAYVEDSGEGRWTVHEALERAIPAPVITEALMRRFESRQKNSLALRLTAALRHQFGGHAVRSPEAGKSQ